MEDPTDGVINQLRFGIGLMTAFVGNDPNASGHETSPKGIERPEGELGGPVKDRVWELDDLRVDTGIKKSGGLVDSSQGSEIRDAEGMYASDFRCQRTKKKETHT